MTTENIQGPPPRASKTTPPPRGPDATAATAAKRESQLVTFYLNEEEFGFDIMNVQEIIRPPTIARVPRTPGYVDGVANLRGVVLPIIDTRERFGLARTADTDRTRVLVIDNHGEKTGLRVDRVKQVTRIAASDVEPPPAVIQGLSADYLSGVAKLDKGKRIIMALDPAKVCQFQGARGPLGGAAAGASTGDATAAAQRIEIAQFVTFKLGREEFAFPIEQVREILRVEAPKALPDTPDYILGVLTVRGQILSSIDLRRLLQQPSLGDEICGQVAGLRERYATGLQAAGDALARGDVHAVGLGFLEAVRPWLTALKTLTKALMEHVLLIRRANDEALRQAAAAERLRADAPGESRRLLEQEVLRHARRALEGLVGLDRAVRDNTREDQRIIVVETRGLLLGLVVDQVKEVKNVAKALIDPAPPIAGDGIQLSGIAKLDEGARLLLLLDATRLLPQERLDDLRQRSGTGAIKRETGAITMAQDSDGSERQLVTFRLGDEEFGVPISQIQEIDRSSRITWVPRAPSFVAGITNLRGEIVPVIDARERFGLPTKAADDRTRVIIIDLGGVKTGLLVDSVRQVLNVSTRDIAPPPAAITAGAENAFISGIGKVEGGKRMIVLLDMEKILSSQEQGALANVARAGAR